MSTEAGSHIDTQMRSPTRSRRTADAEIRRRRASTTSRGSTATLHVAEQSFTAATSQAASTRPRQLLDYQTCGGNGREVRRCRGPARAVTRWVTLCERTASAGVAETFLSLSNRFFSLVVEPSTGRFDLGSSSSGSSDPSQLVASSSRSHSSRSSRRHSFCRRSIMRVESLIVRGHGLDVDIPLCCLRFCWERTTAGSQRLSWLVAGVHT